MAPRSRDTLDALVEQDGLFSVATLADGYAMSVFIGDTFALQAASTLPNAAVRARKERRERRGMRAI